MFNEMKEMCGSITLISNNLVVSVSGDMDDNSIIKMSENILSKTEKWQVSGAVFDFSSVKVMDIYMFRCFYRTSCAMELLGAKVIWSGINPMVVASLIDLIPINELEKIQTSINLQQGINHLTGIRSDIYANE